MTQIGDLWVNLHIFGAIAGTYFFGAILALIFRRLRYGVVTRSVFPSLVFAVHLPQLLQGFEVSFDFTMTALPKSLLVYFIVAWILARRRAPPQTGANTVLTP
jgi:ABC-type sulfate transport system permease component